MDDKIHTMSVRETINRYFLSKKGQEELRIMLETGQFELKYCEEGALLRLACIRMQFENDVDIDYWQGLGIRHRDEIDKNVHNKDYKIPREI